MKRAKQRDSNFEVLRILSMCGIIAVHYMNNEIGGAVQNAVFPNLSALIKKICNDCFLWTWWQRQSWV